MNNSSGTKEPWITEVQSIEDDMSLVEQLVRDARKAHHPSEIDVHALRAANPKRLGGPLIRRAVEGTQTMPVRVDDLHAEWIAVPGGSARITILYLHGGAFIRGSLLQGRGIASALASATGGRAFAIAYRQAPEATFPAPVDDAVAAYRYLLSAGVPQKSIVIAGDSSGGGIAVAATVAIRDQGLPLPAATIGFSPFADLTLSGPSRRYNAEKDITGLAFAQAAIRVYLGGRDPADPLASPVNADLRGLPPLLIIVGSHESMYSEAAALASAAHRAGVKVVQQTYAGMIHVFPMFTLKTGDLAFQNAAEFILSCVSE
jgi:acetyl esterase/lipase